MRHDAVFDVSLDENFDWLVMHQYRHITVPGLPGVVVWFEADEDLSIGQSDFDFIAHSANVYSEYTCNHLYFINGSIRTWMEVEGIQYRDMADINGGLVAKLTPKQSYEFALRFPMGVRMRH